jgi:hypothetical protein
MEAKEEEEEGGGGLHAERSKPRSKQPHRDL